jgi:flagellar hook protein FlgE
MSLLTAIDSSLAGLNAQAAALSNISNNVANSSTVGYKEADTQFESMVLASGASGSGTSALAGAQALTEMNISTAGQIQTTGVATDVAVNGAGFLVVNNQVNSSQGNYLLTRAGSFRPDANGNLVNAGGYYLQGLPLNQAGAPAGGAADTLNDLSTVNIANLSAQATPTTQMTFTANLPSTNTAYSATPPAPSTTTVQYFDPLGATQSLQFSFTPTVPATAGSPPSNTWTMNVYDSASATPTTPVGTATLAFESTGPNAGMLQSVNATAGTYNAAAGTLSITTGSGQALPITIGSPDTAGGMTQLDGAYTTSAISKNGNAFGLLQGVTIGNDGKVVASFTNGSTRPIYQLDLATVPAPDSLTPVSGGAYALSPGAGVPQLFQAGQGPTGTTDGGALEGSNVDLGTQLTNLIETQRAYSSNAEVIKSATDMLDVVNHLNG